MKSYDIGLLKVGPTHPDNVVRDQIISACVRSTRFK